MVIPNVMVIPVDSVFLLWVVGIWQPIQPSELVTIINNNFKGQIEKTTEDEVYAICQKYVESKLFVRVHRKPNMYSLSQKGNDAIVPAKLRYSRDTKRLFLLRDVNRSLIKETYGEGNKELGGVAPSMRTRSLLQSSEANGSAFAVPTSQSRWPRSSKQLLTTGETPSPYAENFPEFLSFFEKVQIPVARGITKKDPNYSLALIFDKHYLALMMGISVQLIDSILANKKRYYDSFSIVKKSGSSRSINAPRVFLKIIQRFLLDYYLSALPFHSCVHSFTKGKSVVNNADVHKGKAFVGTIDIENFFDSIKKEMISQLLKKNDYTWDEADFIANLCTKDNSLPQGAPTSPALSNALLFAFDDEMDTFTRGMELTYSRYADDLTISGGDKIAVQLALDHAVKKLDKGFSLKINTEKTRIISFNGRQVVTGLVVNEKVQPPRYKRRQIRAAFHNASKKDHITTEELYKLRGYYGYLASIPDLKNSKELKNYKLLLPSLNTKTAN